MRLHGAERLVLERSGCLPWDRASRDAFLLVMQDPRSTARWLASRFGPKEAFRRALTASRSDVLGNLDGFAPVPAEYDTKYCEARVVDEVLCDAAGDGDVRLVRLAIDAGADVNVCEGGPIRMAAWDGHVAVAKVLVEAGADPDYADIMEEAATRGHEGFVRFLLLAGAEYVQSQASYMFFWDEVPENVRRVFREAGVRPDHQLVLPPGEHDDDGLHDHGNANGFEKALRLAAMHGTTDVVDALIGAGVQARVHGARALKLAARHGHARTVARLLEAGAPGREVALYWALRKRQAETARLLVLAGAIVDGALGVATRSGHLLCDVFEGLVETGAIRWANGGGALSFAARTGRVEFVRAVLDAGADVAAHGGRALVRAAAYAQGDARWDVRYEEAAALASLRRTQVIRALAEAGADVGANAAEALREAAEHGHVDVVRTLRDLGADVAVAGVGALHLAVQKGGFEFVEALVDAGTRVGDAGGGVLRVAAEKGREALVRSTILQGVDVARYGGEAVRLATKNKFPGIVRTLVESGADPRAIDDDALSGAAYGDDAACIREVLETGADLSARLDEALRRAAKRGYTAVVKVFIEAGANVRAWDDLALALAALYGHAGVVLALLEAGSSPRTWSRGTTAKLADCSPEIQRMLWGAEPAEP